VAVKGEEGHGLKVCRWAEDPKARSRESLEAASCPKAIKTSPPLDSR
jgi:hypothetical protein